MDRTPEQQLRYTKRKLREETKLYEHFVATAAKPPAEKQIRIMKKQAEEVEFWKGELAKLSTKPLA